MKAARVTTGPRRRTWLTPHVRGTGSTSGYGLPDRRRPVGFVARGRRDTWGEAAWTARDLA